MSNGMEHATFAGGCFWCIQGPFDVEEAVSNVRVGFTGAQMDGITYEAVAMGQIKQREGVTMVFDPSKITYRELVDIFLRQIDPTDDGGQFADRGFQYTTAILYHTDEQKRVAEEALKELGDSGKFENPIAVVVEPFQSFTDADENHQSYYKKNPIRYKLYKKGSGREDFIKTNWGKD